MKKKRKKAEPTMAILDQNAGPGKIIGIFRHGKQINTSEFKAGHYEFKVKDGEVHIVLKED